MGMTDDIDRAWKLFVDAHSAYVAARMDLFATGGNSGGHLVDALRSPGQRPAALELLEFLPEAESRAYLAELVALASWVHGDILAARHLIGRMDREWVMGRIDAVVVSMLDDEESYRRFAELYVELGGDLLSSHLRRCAEHADPEVREIAADFA